MPTTLQRIQELNQDLEKRFRDKLILNPQLKRTLVSFQANKKAPGYRWYKFKEGYSSALVTFLLDQEKIRSGTILDPFAGSGTSLFAAAEKGLDAVGIELLPIGSEIIHVRRSILENNDHAKLIKYLKKWINEKPWMNEATGKQINHLKITDGAFPKETEELIGKFQVAISRVKNQQYKKVLRFALLCILEEISFTRKDGQYLRWDYRSGRGFGKKKFDKGEIRQFNSALVGKLEEILFDLNGNNTLFEPASRKPSANTSIEILQGSCLAILPKLETKSFDVLMTSPPYCNRYDYTRTYALELALLGVDEDKIRSLRQTMMACTVENRDKTDLDRFFTPNLMRVATQAFDGQKVLQEILKYLSEQKEKGELNNSGIVRMVKNYFYEMALTIFECARLLKNGAPFLMVNDNVRYAGATIPVDLILSDFAEKAGFEVEKIWVLPTGKGNSSQQMGAHGRAELRKCVYVWRKS